MTKDLLVDVFLLGLCSRVSSDRNSHVRLFSMLSRYRPSNKSSYVMAVT
jgi:hypothetical protein